MPLPFHVTMAASCLGPWPLWVGLGVVGFSFSVPSMSNTFGHLFARQRIPVLYGFTEIRAHHLDMTHAGFALALLHIGQRRPCTTVPVLAQQFSTLGPV